MEKTSKGSMRILAFITLVLISAVSSALTVEDEFPQSFMISIRNPLATDRTDVMIYVSADKIKSIKSDFNAKAFIVLDNGKEISSQYNFKDNSLKGVVFVLDQLKSSEVREIVIRYNKSGESTRRYTKKTQAELSHKVNGEWRNREYIGGEFKNVDYLRVPKEHKDHSWFIRYEGPGWESDKVGYRFYLDQRNATDVFGKTVNEPVLQKVGLDGFDSYHEMQSWGMDVMKTGKSLGIGSIGMWVNDAAIRVETTDSVTSQIDENGNVYSSVLTKYYGWKAGNEILNVDSRLSIHAGTRLTDNVLLLNKDSENLCTGLVKDDKGKLFIKEGDSKSWGYIATYGPQSLNKDNLGVVVFFNRLNFLGFTSDKLSHVVKLRSSNKKLEYYFAGVWEGEPNGIKTEDDFLIYINSVARELANPVQITLRKSK